MLNEKKSHKLKKAQFEVKDLKVEQHNVFTFHDYFKQFGS